MNKAALVMRDLPFACAAGLRGMEGWGESIEAELDVDGQLESPRVQNSPAPSACLSPSTTSPRPPPRAATRSAACIACLTRLSQTQRRLAPERGLLTALTTPRQTEIG
jgi:hypothetical protein